MKTIVISGAHSNVGKTSLAKEVCLLIPGAVHVKLGHGIAKENRGDLFYHTGTPFEHISAQHKDIKFLIIESNSILREMTPDCTIYLSSDEPQKQSALYAMQKAEIKRGSRVKTETIEKLHTNLGLSKKIVRKIVWLAGARPSKTGAIILAGGKSIRMGRNKALLEINGESAVKRLYKSLLPYFDHILLSAGSDKNGVWLDGIPVVQDREKDHGPLMGIYSSLLASPSVYNFVVACDIPEINIPLIFKLLACSEDYEIVVPSFKEGQFEPLFAVYKKSILDAVKRTLGLHKRRVASLFSECNTSIYKSAESAWYVNLNTPSDYHNYLDNVKKVAGYCHE